MTLNSAAPPECTISPLTAPHIFPFTGGATELTQESHLMGQSDVSQRSRVNGRASGLKPLNVQLPRQELFLFINHRANFRMGKPTTKSSGAGADSFSIHILDPYDEGAHGESSSAPLLDPALPTYIDSTVPPMPTPEFQHIEPVNGYDTRCIDALLADELTDDADALHQYLNSECLVPPHPLLTLTGTHSSPTNYNNDNSGKRTITDFALTFSLHHLISGSSHGKLGVVAFGKKTFRGTRTRRPHQARLALPANTTDVDDQVLAFTGSGNSLKTFTVNKRMTVNEDVLREHLLRIVRATNYRGQIKVEFPCEDGMKTVAPDNWVNHIRYGPWRWAFYISMLWIIIWPVLWAMTLRWETVEIVWKQRNVGGGEKAWIDEYGKAIGALVKGKKKGAITEGELKGINDALARPRGEERQAGAGAAIGGFFRGLSEAGETIQGGWGGDETGLGGFGFRGVKNLLR